MEVFAEGYRPREVQFAIVEQNPTLLNVTLQRDVKVLSKATDAPTKINTKLPKESTKKGASKPVVTSDEENEDLVDEKVWKLGNLYIKSSITLNLNVGFSSSHHIKVAPFF